MDGQRVEAVKTKSTSDRLAKQCPRRQTTRLLECLLLCKRKRIREKTGKPAATVLHDVVR